MNRGMNENPMILGFILLGVFIFGLALILNYFGT